MKKLLKIPKSYVIGKQKINYASWYDRFPQFIEIPLNSLNEDMWSKKPDAQQTISDYRYNKNYR